jgi:acetylornithine/N-succinyldiaminopimelate aminotransferase
MTDESLFSTFARAPIAFERGQGVWLYTADGEAYLDAMAGVAVTSVGHAHPHVVDALKRQGEKLWHVSNWFEIPEQAAMAKRLTDLTFADKVFFCNSGAEALECSIKTARHSMAGRWPRWRPADSQSISRASAKSRPDSIRCRSATTKRLRR